MSTCRDWSTCPTCTPGHSPLLWLATHSLTSTHTHTHTRTHSLTHSLTHLVSKPIIHLLAYLHLLPALTPSRPLLASPSSGLVCTLSPPPCRCNSATQPARPSARSRLSSPNPPRLSLCPLPARRPWHLCMPQGLTSNSNSNRRNSRDYYSFRRNNNRKNNSKKISYCNSNNKKNK